MRYSFIALSISLASMVCASTNVSAGQWQSDVIGVQQSQLNSEHWLTEKVSAKAIMSQAQISGFNEKLISDNKHIVDPLDYVTSLSGAKLKEKIFSISS
ncbi:MAG: glycoside hydrolase, partial [Pseudoalteromonas sp.]